MDIESHLLFASKLAVDINDQRAAYEKEMKKVEVGVAHPATEKLIEVGIALDVVRAKVDELLYTLSKAMA
jgi:hypothetical protein